MSDSGFSLYNSIIKPLRDADVTQLLKRFLTGPQIIRDQAEAEILSLRDQVKADKVRADILQFLMPQVGFTSELSGVTSRLTEAQLRRLVRVAVPLWNQRHTRAGLINGIRLLTGRAATVNDWFDYRAIIDEITLSEDIAQSVVPVEQFVDKTSPVGSRSSTIVVSKPATVRPNDVMLVFMWSGETNDSKLNTASIPAGWTLLSEVNTPTRQQVCLLRRKAALGEPSSYTFNEIALGTGFALCASMVVYRDIDPDVALIAANVTDVTGSTTAFSCPSAGLTSYTDIYLGFVAQHAGSEAVTLLPTDTTQRINEAIPGFGWMTEFDLKRWVAGATGNQVVNYSTPSTGVAVGYALAIKPIQSTGALWVIGGDVSLYDEYWTNIRLMDDGTLDELLLLDVCKLMRPLDEHFEVVLLDFLDHFDGVLDKWAAVFGGPIGHEGFIDNAGPYPGSLTVVGDIKPVVPIWALRAARPSNYSITFRFLLASTANQLSVFWYNDGIGYQLFLNGANGIGTLFRGGSTIVAAGNWPIAARFGLNSWNTVHIHTTNIDDTTRGIRITVNGNQAVPTNQTLSEHLDVFAMTATGEVSFSSNLAGTQIDDVEIWTNPIRFATIGISTPTDRGGDVVMTSNFVQ